MKWIFRVIDWFNKHKLWGADWIDLHWELKLDDEYLLVSKMEILLKNLFQFFFYIIHSLETFSLFSFPRPNLSFFKLSRFKINFFLINADKWMKNFIKIFFLHFLLSSSNIIINSPPTFQKSLIAGGWVLMTVYMAWCNLKSLWNSSRIHTGSSSIYY